MKKLSHVIFTLRVTICILIFCILYSPVVFSNKSNLVLYDHKSHILTPYPKDYSITTNPQYFYLKPFPQDKRLTLYPKEKTVPQIPNDYKEYQNNFKFDIILSLFNKKPTKYSTKHLQLRSHKSTQNIEILNTRNSAKLAKSGYNHSIKFSKYQTKETNEKIQAIQFNNISNTKNNYFLNREQIKLEKSVFEEDPENPSPLKQDLIHLTILILIYFSFKHK